MSRHPERGSVLLLFPAALLIVMVLAAIAVDLSAAFLAQREVADAAAAAVNDAAGEGVANRAFYQRNLVQLDPPTVERLAAERVRRLLSSDRYRDVQVDVRVSTDATGCTPSVTAVASAEVPYVFAKAVPGAPDTARVRATAGASPRQGPDYGC